MTDIKEKFISIFKYETELTLRINIGRQKESQQRRVTIDNYISRFTLDLKIEG